MICLRLIPEEEQVINVIQTTRVPSSFLLWGVFTTIRGLLRKR